MSSKPPANPKPLDPAERKQLQELQERDAAAQAAEQEEKRDRERGAFGPISAFLDLLDLEKLVPALDDAIVAATDPDVAIRLQRMRQILDFDGRNLRERRDALHA